MIADDIAGANGLYADLSFYSLTDQPLAGIDSDLAQVSINRTGEDFGNLEGRAAWRVLLQPVVSFNDLDVIIVPKCSGHLADDFADQVDSDTHVRRKDAGNLLGQCFQLIELNSRKAGSPDYHGPSMVSNSPHMLKCRHGRGKIDHHFSSLDQNREIIRDEKAGTA